MGGGGCALRDKSPVISGVAAVDGFESSADVSGTTRARLSLRLSEGYGLKNGISC